jgi:hypothetical protein
VLGFDLPGGEGQQLSDGDRVVEALVDPASAQDAVLAGAEERVVGSLERRVPVAHGHQVPGTVSIRNDHYLDADLTARIIEPEPTRLGERRRSGPPEPGLRR